MQYHFYLVCDEIVYFYTQKEITTYIPDQSHDFVLLTDYVQPAWVKDAVFYQIYPDRFCNGDPENDVQTGEYTFQGHTPIRMDWEAKPLPYREGFCMDFYGGDLEGVRKNIPYLKALGVNAVYLNPIFVAPTVHKYDCIDYFHVDPHFGGNEALEKLSAALHENGMKLILDISINHTGTAHRWFNRDGQFFPKSEGAYNNPDAEERGFYFFRGDTNDCIGWYGHADLPVLNYTSPRLRQLIYGGKDSVLRKWLRPPYSIDGWRFDVADVFARNDEIQLAKELWPKIRDCIREENPQAYILAEDWGDCAPYLQGDAWDSAMNYYGCGRVLRQFAGECDLFMGRNEILRSIPYKMTAADAKARITEHLSKLPFALWQNQFNLLDSHDVPRLHNNPAIHPGVYRGAVMIQFALIGAPSVYYGDEAEIDGETDTNEGFRYPIPWSRAFQDTERFRLYQTLSRLRAAHPALREGGMKFLYAKEDILALARFLADEAFVILMSVGETAQEIELPFAAVGAAGPEREQDVFGTPLIFPRYAGLGSHRYPIGFSGDSISTWDSLRFQTYFTVNASNAGYTWWSHDIGGHQGGRRDDELAVRWLQFGVFSPIMRLHSTANAFIGKEPWNYNSRAEQIMRFFLRLRHRLIPYLYTVNVLTHREGLPLLRPMYYRDDVPEAYEVPNEYCFGTELIVCPITEPMDAESQLAGADVWLPDGIWMDVFTGILYRGGRKRRMCRPLESIPVLAKAGAIMPLAGDPASTGCRKRGQTVCGDTY